MKIWFVACGVACFTVAVPTSGMAQSPVPVVDIAPYGLAPQGLAVGPPFLEGPLVQVLPPHEIVASVRSAGFDPLSRPIHRGGVYLVFAIDRYDADVRVTVDAHSGRVLSAMRLAGEVYDEPGHDGYAVPPRASQGYVAPYERPPRLYERAVPMPPADVQGYGSGYGPPRAYGSPPIPEADIRLLPREHSRTFDAPTRESMRRVPTTSSSHPLPRLRPSGDAVTGAARQGAPQMQSAPSTASPPPAPLAAPPPPPPASAQVPVEPPAPHQPAMVPVAPLE
jgi:hypothetical protein